MIGNLTYEQINAISLDLKKQIEIINRLIQNKNSQELQDFVSTVEGYTKYLETTIEMNKDADNALSELKNKKK